jgi:integral membrane protein
VSGAVTRYRVMAYVVGTALLVLVLVAMPLKYLGGNPTLVRIVGPLHGGLYIVYLVLAFDVAFRRRWSLGWTLLMLLAGTVPFLTFVVERMVSRRIEAESTVESA